MSAWIIAERKSHAEAGAIRAEETNRLFERLKAEGAHLFYVKMAVEFGTLGDD